MITLVDYGLGNIRAFFNIYKSLGIDCTVANDVSTLNRASRLILPGVGAFDWAMLRLDCSGLRPVLDNLVLNHRLPVLGICVGMQMMANCSDEGSSSGLGWIPGEVKIFDESLLPSTAKLPHMGWNDVNPQDHPLFANIFDPRFYFLHGYRFLPTSPENVLAETEYGLNFASAVCKENVIGVQFHPEKSHHWGVQLLHNFANFNP